VFDRDTTELFFARTDAEIYSMDAAIIKDLRGD